MANDEHRKIFALGIVPVRQWKTANPGGALDLSELDFSNFDFRPFDLPPIIFNNAILAGAHFEGLALSHSVFRFADLSGAHLQGARCNACNFESANLTGADITGTDFTGTDLTRAKVDAPSLSQAILVNAALQQLALEGVDFRGHDLRQTRFAYSKLSGAVFSRAVLDGADFTNADLTRADFDGAHLDGANLSNTNLTSASLMGASLYRTNLQGANLTEANVAYARFQEATVNGADFRRIKGVRRATDLETTYGDPRYFETVDLDWLDKRISWESLRAFGRLPIFGASYFALVAIPIFFYFLDLYNRKVDLLRVWAEQQQAAPGVRFAITNTMLEHLHREPIPSLSLTAFVAAVLLATAATLFATTCPPRIKEFSRDQWRVQFGHPLIQYLPLAWKHRGARVICACLYLIGGAGAIWVIGNKLVSAFRYIVENSPVSDWWW